MSGRPALTFDARPAGLFARLAPFRQTLGTTGGLVLATTVNSATGFVFWWIAARTFPPAAVGIAAAAISAMLLLSQLSVLGLGTAMAGVLHREARPWSLAVTALLAATGIGLLVGSVFAIVAPGISEELGEISAAPLALAVFASGVALTAGSAVLDQILVAMLRNVQQLMRNIVFSLSRLVLVVLAAVLLVPASGMAIYGSWLVGTAISILLVALLPANLSQLRGLWPLQWGRLGSMAFGALSHHVLNLSRSASVWLLPIVVTVLLSPEVNAAFYVALLLANFIALVGTSATFTLYVIAARAPEQLAHQMRVTVGISLLAAVVGSAVIALGGRLLLMAFGSSYADVAYPTVVVLALSTIPLVVKDHWIALQRLHGTVARGAAIGVLLLVMELAAGALGAMEGGILGLALARLAVLAIQAVFMAPVVLRAMRVTSPGGPEPAAA
jgi:O-antigen/teichoic acid export membrane protein